ASHPGRCPSRAHDRDCLGLGGRRVLVSRQWSGKTLTEHRADRAAVAHQALEAAGIDTSEARRCAADVLADDGQPRYVWEDVPLAERDYARVILASITERRRWLAQYEHAKTIAAQRPPPPGAPVDTHSATDHMRGEAA
ncbi:MAG: replication initiator, partial [Phycicoccus sp.]